MKDTGCAPPSCYDVVRVRVFVACVYACVRGVRASMRACVCPLEACVRAFVACVHACMACVRACMHAFASLRRACVCAWRACVRVVRACMHARVFVRACARVLSVRALACRACVRAWRADVRGSYMRDHCRLSVRLFVGPWRAPAQRVFKGCVPALSRRVRHKAETDTCACACCQEGSHESKVLAAAVESLLGPPVILSNSDCCGQDAASCGQGALPPPTSRSCLELGFSPVLVWFLACFDWCAVVLKRSSLPDPTRGEFFAPPLPPGYSFVNSCALQN